MAGARHRIRASQNRESDLTPCTIAPSSREPAPPSLEDAPGSTARARVLLCGFGPFPGVPANPSAAAARRLAGTRRPALSGLDIHLEILPTRWSSPARVADLVRRLKPDAVLLLGVAARRGAFCVEGRAVNAASGAPDAARGHAAHRRLLAGAPDMRVTPTATAPLVAALRLAGLPARHSRDAGRYLCNATYFQALQALAAAGRPAAPAVFVHLPGGAVLRDAAHSGRMARGLAALLAALAGPIGRRRPPS